MVIEYSGIVIRSVLTDKREKYYNSKVSSTLRQYIFQQVIIGTYFYLLRM